VRVVAVLLLLGTMALTASACGQDAAQTAGESPPAPAPRPDVAVIRCEETGASVTTPEVRPQRDGVHLRITNETDAELAFAVDDPRGGGGGFDILGTAVLDLHPGPVQVSCYDPRREDPSEIPGEPLEIVDEEGIWVSPRLDCGQVVAQVLDYMVDARGTTGPPLDAARSFAEEQGLTGEVEPAGYPEWESPVYRVVSGGRVVSAIVLLPDGAGGWLLSQVDRCSA
jgi:hypothetical protein